MLKSTLKATLLIFATAVSLQAQSAEQQQMIAADRGLLEDMTGPSPRLDVYERALAPDFIAIEQGAVHSRAEDAEQMKVIRDFKFQYENPQAVLLTPNSGYVIAEVSYSGLMHGTLFQSQVLTTTVFTLEHGQWLARMQESEPMKPHAVPVAAVPDNDPKLVELRALAARVEEKVRVPGYPTFTPPKVMLDGGMGVSYFSYDENTVHEAQLGDLPAPMQGIWNQWAAYTTDQPSGQALFNDMFHRFFFVHELGHWMAGDVIAGLPDSSRGVVAKNEFDHKWERETTANRIAVAWYREQDPDYLKKLVSDFRRIQSHLPDPVPAGVDKKAYFTENYAKLGKDPMAYGWYQLQMVILVYDEPARTFQQVLDTLPMNRYE